MGRCSARAGTLLGRGAADLVQRSAHSGIDTNRLSPLLEVRSTVMLSQRTRGFSMRNGRRSTELLATLAACVIVAVVGCGDDTNDENDGGDSGNSGESGDSGDGGRARGGSGGTSSEDGGQAGDDQAGGVGTISVGASGGEGGESGAGLSAFANRARDILETSLDIDASSRRGVASILLQASDSPGASFEVGGLTIRGVRHAAEAVPWTVQDGWLHVDMPASEETLSVAIEYGFNLQSEFRGLSSAGFTFTWPYWCGNVFPCHSDPANGVRFSLNVTGGRNTLVFPAEIPSDAPSYMLAWADADYTRVNLGRTAAGTRVSVWHVPGGAAAATAGSEFLLQAFDWLEQNLGPYRFGSDVGSLSAPWMEDAVGGMEHHPYWHIAPATMDDPATHIHEAAHGWFGNGVRIRCWEDFVLSEGTASYLAARILSEVGAPSLAENLWTRYELNLQRALARGNPPVAWLRSCGEVDIIQDRLFSSVPYTKGAFFYRAIEERVGRALLDAALAAFYERWAGRAAGMQDMLDILEEVTGYDPTRCANAWLLGAAVPAVDDCP